MKKGCVFDIQRFSLSDGPGIRTSVFLKGCNLRCLWCHNPESQLSGVEIEYLAKRCFACGKCVEACPNGAQFIDAKGIHGFDRSKCDRCGLCTSVCEAKALKCAGSYMTSGEVMDEVARDEELYFISGGGLTISGGEPLLQPDFVMELAAMAKKYGIDTAIETAGFVNYGIIKEISPNIDLFLYDLKAYAEDTHIACTGQGAEKIRDNLSRLARHARIWVRIPLVKDVNDDPEEIEQMAVFLRSLEGVEQIEMLPYHTFGEGKYLQIGRNVVRFQKPNEKRMQALESILKTTGKKVIFRGK